MTNRPHATAIEGPRRSDDAPGWSEFPESLRSEFLEPAPCVRWPSWTRRVHWPSWTPWWPLTGLAAALAYGPCSRPALGGEAALAVIGTTGVRPSFPLRSAVRAPGARDRRASSLRQLAARRGCERCPVLDVCGPEVGPEPALTRYAACWPSPIAAALTIGSPPWPGSGGGGDEFQTPARHVATAGGVAHLKLRWRPVSQRPDARG